jgi:hypothetical protein
VGFAQGVVVAAQGALELEEIPGGQELEVIGNDGQGQVADLAGRQGAQLQGQALADVGGADAGRVEALDLAQGDLEVVDFDLELGGSRGSRSSRDWLR